MSSIRQYLHLWAAEGPTRAGRYLVTGQRRTSDQGSPRIDAGTAMSYRLYRWRSPEEFTLLVSMDLVFTNRPMAWNRGVNDRFVTAHRVGPDRRYLLELASGP